MIYSDKMQEIASKMGFTLSDFSDTLEQERRKVLMFQRELPLCLELVTYAIDCCRQQLSETTTENRQSECSEQTSSEMGPVLEEFIPINRNGVSDFEQQQSRETQTEKNDDSDRNNLNLFPSDWLRSAQLWNQTSDPPPLHQEQDLPEKTAVVEVKRNGGAFRPFQKEKPGGGGGGTSSSSAPAPAAATSSTAETGSDGSNRREEKEAQNQRKQRRCWSPELHRRFLHALQQLGGSHVATPKQIRELMKVDGLTNDEVKSHLQKYRLHTRRPSPTMHNNDSAQAPQFLVVGGIWVPAAEYATTSSGEAVSAATTNGIYAPVVAAAAPQPLLSSVQKPKPKPKPKVASADCISPSTSSSTHTSSVSPPS